MRTQIEPDNPCGYNRYGFAWQHVPAGGSAHLDFGCGDAGFLAALESKGIGRRVGVDVGREVVERAAERFGGLDIRHVEQAAPLPFGAGEFASATMLDVLEHVHEQDALLGELWRVLCDDGILIVTVPRRYVFSFLDLGNVKFRFPRLHRWCYCLNHSRAEYERRYVTHPDGLVGDVSARKRWHEHFTPAKLEKLLNRNGFSVLMFDGSGFFMRILKIADLLFRRVGPLRRAVRKIMAWDARRFGSANLFCVARKGRGRQEERTDE